MKKLLFAVVAASSINTSLQAETLVYQAISDFPDITSGVVPYSLDNNRSALQINASIEAYRDKFARATTVYSGNGGVYDVTITTLGEIDGEGAYRFLVNGQIVASALNDRTEDDFSEQTHTFDNIDIPASAEIAVESNAVSNGLIPENDIFAFARGRWTTLTLIADDTATTPAVDLTLSAEVDNNSPAVGQSISISFDMMNESESVTATNPALQITLPAQLTLDSQSQCNASGTTVNCILAEIAPGAQSTLTLNATATQSGTAEISATISADQHDNNVANNTVVAAVDVVAVTTPPPPIVVDLAVDVSSDVAIASVGDIVNYTVTTVNNHPDNVATLPVISILFPADISFSDSNDCTVNEERVTCNLQELSGGQTAKVSFSAITNAAGTPTLNVSASAAEAEENIDNNEVLFSINVEESSASTIDSDRDNSTPDATPITTPITTNGAGNGGGSITPFTLLLLCTIALSALRHRRTETA